MAHPVRLKPVKIVIEVPEPGRDRLTGVARREGSDEGTDFSGAIELLGLIEDLCRGTRPDGHATPDL